MPPAHAKHLSSGRADRVSLITSITAARDTRAVQTHFADGRPLLVSLSVLALVRSLVVRVRDGYSVC